MPPPMMKAGFSAFLLTYSSAMLSHEGGETIFSPTRSWCKKCHHGCSCTTIAKSLCNGQEFDFFPSVWSGAIVRIRATFPQVYKLHHKKTDDYYFLVSARSERWGMNERKTFPTEKEALDHARQIEEKLQNFGAQKDVPNEKAVMADAYAKLVDRLVPYSKSPEDAVSFYLVHLGTEMSRQAKPPLSELVDKWEKEKLTSKIKPLAYRTKTELKQYPRFLRRTWGNQKLDDVTRQMVKAAVNELSVRNRNTHRSGHLTSMFDSFNRIEISTATFRLSASGSKLRARGPSIAQSEPTNW